MSTTIKNSKTVTRLWYEFDASKRTLGRLATSIAMHLMGKHRVDFTPHVDMGDYAVVFNISNLKVTGRKLEQKKYHRFSGYPGGITSTRMVDMLAHKPEEIVREAVRRMLPKNKLRKSQLRRLKLIRGPEHSLKIDSTVI